MRQDDQWFTPGDKIMRINPQAKKGTWTATIPKGPQMGVVYCVDEFWEGPQFNVISIIGLSKFMYDDFGQPVGWRASYFRKVEEIALCIAAVKRAPNQVEA